MPATSPTPAPTKPQRKNTRDKTRPLVVKHKVANIEISPETPLTPDEIADVKAGISRKERAALDAQGES